MAAGWRGPEFDRKFLVQPDRWSLLSSTALRTVSYLYTRARVCVYVAVQESVEAKATLAPGLLWRLVRSNRCPVAACIHPGKRFHYSTGGVYGREYGVQKSLRGEEKQARTVGV